MAFMTEAAEAGFRDAIQAIEDVSAAEVVVAIRPRLRRWWLGNVIVGALLMSAVVAFELFSEDYEFELWSMAVTPVMALVIGMMLVELIAPLERLLTPRSVTDGFLRDEAHAAFYELGVHGTKGRTGVLVMLALQERRAILVGDLAVAERVKLDHQAATLTGDGVAVAKALAALAPEYAKALPRAHDDINELADDVRPRSFRGAVR